MELDQLDELISDASELFRDTTNALGSLRGPDNKDAVDSATKHLRRRFVALEERLIKLRLVPLAEILERAAVRAGRIAARQVEKEVEFLKNYAQEHGTTVAEIFARYVKRLKSSEKKPIHPDIVKITGLVPRNLDAQSEYRQHLLDKHR